MALYDWNKDGNKDGVDDYIEYNVYKDSTRNSCSNSGASSDWWKFLLLAIIVGVCPAIGAIIFFGILIFGK